MVENMGTLLTLGLHLLHLPVLPGSRAVARHLLNVPQLDPEGAGFGVPFLHSPTAVANKGVGGSGACGYFAHPCFMGIFTS